MASNDGDLEILRPKAIFHGRYEVVRCVKAGGMGAVYEVVDAGTRRRRALKTMLPGFVSDPDMRARFHLEATVAADIESEHIVEVFDAGVDEATSLPFLVMELLKGQTLSEALEVRGRLPPNEVVTLLHQASMALDKTHTAGIVHRDLKPENLFLTRRDDGSARVKLLDFGIAKVVAESGHQKTTRNLGTPLYMSPEQIRGDGDIGPRSDLYSLGQIGFSLLTGRPYWDPESRRATGVYALLVKIMEGAPDTGCERATQFGVGLPSRFDGWFRRATALDPSDRFDSASELVEELAIALDVPVPHSAHRISGDPAKPATSAKPSRTGSRAVSNSKTSRDDSTGAVATGLLTRGAARREKLVWAGLVAVTLAGGLAFIARNTALPTTPESAATVHGEPSLPATPVVVPGEPSAAPLEAHSMPRALPVGPSAAASGPGETGRPPKSAVSKTSAPRASVPARVPPASKDPSDIR